MGDKAASQETGDKTDGQVKGRQRRPRVVQVPSRTRSRQDVGKKSGMTGSSTAARKPPKEAVQEPVGLVLEFMPQGLACSCTHSELEEQATVPVWSLL